MPTNAPPDVAARFSDLCNAAVAWVRRGAPPSVAVGPYLRLDLEAVARDWAAEIESISRELDAETAARLMRVAGLTPDLLRPACRQVQSGQPCAGEAGEKDTA